MKQWIVPAFAALLAPAFYAPAAAQTASGKNGKEDIINKEKVVIRLDDDGKTEIQIKGGVITVNGEEIMTVADATNGRTEKTIIIEGNPAAGGGFNPFSGFGESAGPAKAALGVQFDPRTEEKDGALVKDVTAGSAAEKAGLKAGDVITKVDETTIRTGSDLVEAISTYKPGEEVEVTYKRGTARSATVKATLGKAPVAGASGRSFRMGPDGRMEEGGGMPNGMESMPFNFDFPEGFGKMFGNPAPRPKLGITGEDRSEGDGVTVKDVHAESPAAAAGLKNGDVITGFGGKDVETLADLQESLRRMEPGSTASISFKRNGSKKTAEVKLPRPKREEEL